MLIPDIFFVFSRELQKDTAIMEEIFWKIIMIFQVLVHAKHFVSFSLDANTLFIMQKRKIANFFRHQAELAIWSVDHQLQPLMTVLSNQVSTDYYIKLFWYIHSVSYVYTVLPFYDVKCLCSGGRELGREGSHSH